MAKRSGLSRESLFIILCGAVIVAVLIFLIAVEIGNYRRGCAGVAQERAAVAREEARLRHLITLSREADLLQERLDRYERLIPDRPLQPAVIRDLQAIAEQSRTTFVEVEFDRQVPRTGYVEVPLKLAYEGRNEGLLALLSNLQGWQRAIRIDGVKVGKGRGDYPVVVAEIDASIFFRLQESLASPASGQNRE